ncbi:MAG: redoxin domain-containing protein [Candidatus Eremiobacteraeota bacterium]|nr:redoxin domain-containing protein [Candidatus Eremiobacteraeota bacterium]MBV8281417.1 redoxin domain-containing protein [Candidatus Eremiobacteraeota bacterium]
MLGRHAPDFTLLDQDSIPVTLSDVLGRAKAVLIFYVLDFTLG